ncbi:acetyl-CoA C-acetyltransferase [Kineococcus aurantiacus]|uniref:Acetyl-CoA C-acetyltransferase n=1 Tax=Kineococcus aurantiacus TaxID=37633 RepID=A0A7Y9DML0_9ACTN|nr:acetyl-CoA C-acetyltransferase [Kineococcus aurantiacus]
MTRRAAIVGGNRTPFVRAGHRYAQVSAQDLLVAALDGLVARYGLAGERLGEVVAGAVLKHSRDLNLTREAVLSTALDPATPAYDVQQACATGLETAVLVANKIALGQVEAGIAGGTDSASDAPVAVDDGLRRVLLELSRAKTPRARLAALAKLRPGQLRPAPPRNAEARTGLSMGEHAARTALEFSLTRQAQDELALASHRNLAAAYDRGFFDDLLTPYLGVRRDDLLRPDTTLDKLAALDPVFGRDLPGEATMTAGNSTPLTDGAAVVLLASDEWAAARRLPVLAHLVDAETAAVDHVHGEGLLTAPVVAAPRLLQRTGLTLADFDLVEVHEAFASTVLATLAAWERDGLGTVARDRLNVTGSSLATGHPFAATGARLLATTAKLLHERGGGRALISVCAAGGQGIVAVVEA